MSNQQLAMLQRLNAQREHRLAAAVAKCERDRDRANDELQELSRSRQAAALARKAKISELSEKFGGPEHIWAYTDACDTHKDLLTQEAEAAVKARVDAGLKAAAVDVANALQVAARRRSAKLEELQTILSDQDRGRYVR